MKKGEKIKFTPEQRESLLHLYAKMLMTTYSSEVAQDRAALANSSMWHAIIESLDLDTKFNYRLLPEFSGVIAIDTDPVHEVNLDTLKTLKEYEELINKITKHFATPSETTESDTSSDSVM